jgi:hypothetical protein
MRNTYVLLVLQALLTLLLFFSEKYVLYVTVALFLLMDLLLFISLFSKRWSYEELLTFAAVACSILFLAFFLYSRTFITTIFGACMILLFLVIAMLEYLSLPISTQRLERLQKPEEPAYPYDMEYDFDAIQRPQQKTVVSRSVPVQRHADESNAIRDKTAARAVAHELEREAKSLRDAEKMITDMEIYDAGRELTKESKALEDVQRQMDAAKKVQAAKEFNKEAIELMKVQQQIDQIKKLQQRQELEREARALKDVERKMKKVNTLNAGLELQREAKSLKDAERKMKKVNTINAGLELQREAKSLKDAERKMKKVNTANTGIELRRQAKSLKNAEKQINEIQFLNQQEKIVRQAKEIAKEQKEIDDMNKKNKSTAGKKIKSASKPKIRIVKVKDESFYFATDTGNSFHEPGCLSIKKVPKNKLTLFTSRKDAMKKGLQPCKVCIPR